MLLFKDIKQNYPVYILDTQEFSLIQGKATQVSFPRSIRNEPEDWQDRDGSRCYYRGQWKNGNLRYS